MPFAPLDHLIRFFLVCEVDARGSDCDETLSKVLECQVHIQLRSQILVFSSRNKPCEGCGIQSSVGQYNDVCTTSNMWLLANVSGDGFCGYVGSARGGDSLDGPLHIYCCHLCTYPISAYFLSDAIVGSKCRMHVSDACVGYSCSRLGRRPIFRDGFA